MSRVVSCVKASFALAGLLLVAGCAGTPADGYKGERGQVSGTVTLDGAPVPKGCQVIFMSTKGGFTGSGIVDEKGQYTLAYGVAAGLPVGDYEVQLTAPLTPAASTEPVDPSKMAASMKLGPSAAGSAENLPFPLKYASARTSGLVFKVAASKNVADFKLEKAAK